MKGKQGTKGNKQIVEENVSTLKFYLYMSLGTCALYFLVVIALFNDPFRLLTIVICRITFLIRLPCIIEIDFISDNDYNMSNSSYW